MIVRILEKSQDDWGVTLKVQIVYDVRYRSGRSTEEAPPDMIFIASYKHDAYGSLGMWTMWKVEEDEI